MSLIIQPGARLDVPTHRYTLDGEPVDASVTQRIAQDITHESFNSDEMSRAVFALCQRMRRFPDSEWAPKQREQYAKHGRFASAEAIAAFWVANRDNGTETHATIEHIIRGTCSLDEPRAQTPVVLHFLAFRKWLSRRYRFVAVEATVVVPRLRTGGQVDALCQRVDGPDNELLLVDWKIMGAALINDSEQRGTCAYFGLPKCKRAKQEIQLNMYAAMIEEVTPYRIVGMMLVYLDAENGVDIGYVPRRPEIYRYLDALEASFGETLLTPADDVKHLRTR